MAGELDTGTEVTRNAPGAVMTAIEVDDWFVREILPLESALMEYLQHNWRNKSDVYDFRQEIYMRVYETALREVPERPRQFLFATARNLLIDRVRHARVIPIEAAADVEALEIAADTPTPDRSVLARDELRVLQAALDGLPDRCRQAIILGRVDGLSRSEIAARMGVTEAAVSNYMSAGIRKLVEAFYGEARVARRQP